MSSLEMLQSTPGEDQIDTALSPEQIAADQAVIDELETQFNPSSALLVDVVGVALGEMSAPEDQIRGITATSMSTTNPSEED